MLFGLSDAQAQPGRTLSGVVRSAADGQPLQGASVRTGKQQGISDKDGKFQIQTSEQEGSLEVKHLGYKTRVVKFNSHSAIFDIRLEADESQIETVEVVSTGYQKIPRERATGSFEFVDSALFNRKVSTDFVSRLEDVVPSISSIKISRDNGADMLNVHVRGISSINSNIWPLIVIDGVPYHNNFDINTGYFRNINPNDIESVTVLKDAAAASIWGAQSGNGVIVLTTKKGRYNQPFRLSLNSNATIGSKPDLYYYPQMNTSDYIDLERQMFDAGYWNSRMNRYSTNLTPVIQLLKKHREGQLSEEQLETELNALRTIDMRDDFLKYIYRPSLNQQYSLQLSGGGEKISTNFSVGYDGNKESLVTSSYERLSFRNSTQLKPTDKLVLDIGFAYTESQKKSSNQAVGYNGMGRGRGNFPYMRLANDAGEPLAVDAIPYNPIFRDTVAGGRLLDWKYRPLEELDDSYLKTNIRETFLNAKGDYEVLPWMRFSALYTYQRASQPTEEWRGIGSVKQREYINYRASWTKDEVIWGIPVGDFLNRLNRTNSTHQGRAQLDINRNWNDGRHVLHALAGAEIREVRSHVASSTFYGYDPETMTYQTVAYGQRVKALNGIGGSTILDDFSQVDAFVNRYTSSFANASYTYLGKYVVSGSARKDASNLFGVRTNRRGQPFWSLGAAWVLSNESFAQADWLQLLKLRVTYGYNGNVNNGTAAYPIIYKSSSSNAVTGQPYAFMQSPPNPSLRWERVGMLNMGMDFSIAQRLTGAVEYYVKRPKDLIAAAAIDPTTGFAALSVNSADLEGKGVDVSLNSVNLRSKKMEWTSHLVFAYSRTKVKKSYLSNDRASNYRSHPFGLIMTPIEGMDIYSLLTYKWAGLDPENGMPRGYLDGEISTDYSALVNRSTVYDLENHGSLMPLYFGSLRNQWRYGNVALSANISYQLGHKFLRSSFSSRWFIESGWGHADYAKRWQQPGDEQYTDVPPFIYPNNLNANELYYYSSALVESASQIKWRDLQLSYQLPARMHKSIKNIRLYAYAQHIGTIWRANKQGLDPEYGEDIPDPFTMSIGIHLNL